MMMMMMRMVGCSGTHLSLKDKSVVVDVTAAVEWAFPEHLQ